MKAFVLGVVLMGVISVAAYYVLETMGFSQAQVSASSPNVRLDGAGSDGE